MSLTGGRHKSLRISSGFSGPLNHNAVAQLTRALELQSGETVSSVYDHFTATLAQNPAFVERLGDMITLATARNDLESEPDPHMPEKEADLAAREAVMREVLRAVKTGQLELPHEMIGGAITIVKKSMEGCIQVVDQNDQELA